MTVKDCGDGIIETADGRRWRPGEVPPAPADETGTDIRQQRQRAAGWAITGVYYNADVSEEVAFAAARRCRYDPAFTDAVLAADVCGDRELALFLYAHHEGEITHKKMLDGRCHCALCEVRRERRR